MGSGFPVTDLVPRVSSVRRVDEDGDDLGLWQEGGGPLGGHLRVKVVGTLLKVVVRTSVGWQGEVLHIPNAHAQTHTNTCHKLALRRQESFLVRDATA